MVLQVILKIKTFSIIGTLAIAKKISENTENNSLISVLGGGDTISALNKSNDKFFLHTYQQQAEHF